MLKRVAAAAALSLLGALVIALPAAAHSEIESTTPESGSKVDKVPPQITLEMSEDPGQGSFIKATDGCNNKVPGETTESGAELVFTPGGGAEGEWDVDYKAISAEDGHVTKGDFSFTVAGKPDCSKDKGEGDQVAGGEDTRVDNPDQDESSFPIVPVIIGGAILIVLILMLRRSSKS